MANTDGSGNKSSFFFLFIAVGLLVIGLVAGYILQTSGQEGATRPDQVSLSVKGEKAFAEATAKYLCPCGACAEPLAECTCETARKVKLDTKKRLAQEEDVKSSDVVWILKNIHNVRPVS